MIGNPASLESRHCCPAIVDVEQMIPPRAKRETNPSSPGPIPDRLVLESGHGLAAVQLPTLIMAVYHYE
jgi:hypothetical protein